MKIFYLLLLSVWVSKCESEKKKPEKAISQQSLIDDSIVVLLNKVKIYAENYTSLDSNKIVELPASIPDSITSFFKQLRVNGDKEYGKYLTLIFLKIYRNHIECCNQGYDLKRTSMGIDSASDPLLYEFNMLTKFFDHNKAEFINSFMPIKWIEKNPILLEYDEIQKELKKVQKWERENRF